MRMSSVARNSVIVTGLNTAAQVASFVLFAGIAKIFGATARTDAFFLALTIPMVLIGPVMSAVRAVFIPIVSECRAKHPEMQGRFVGCVLAYSLLLSFILVVLLAVSAPLVLPFAAKGLALEQRHLVTMLTILLLPLVVCQSAAAVLGATFNACGRFALPAIAAGSRHLVAVVLLVTLHGRLDVMVLPLAFVAGAVFQLILLASRWRTLEIPIHWTFRTLPEFGRSLRLAIPLIGSSIALYAAILVTRFLASWLPEGSVTILDYAFRIITALMEVLTSGVLLVVLARWSVLAQSGGRSEVHISLRRAIILILFILMPVIVTLYALRVPAVALLLGRGRFDPALAAATASVFGVLLIGVPADIVARVYGRLFLVHQNTWVNGIAAATRLAVVVALSLLLLHPLGLHGLAIAEVLGIVSVTLVMHVAANRAGAHPLAGAAAPVSRIVALSLVAGTVASLASIALRGKPALAVVAAGAVAGGLAYVGLAWLLRIRELRALAEVLSASLRNPA